MRTSPTSWTTRGHAGRVGLSLLLTLTAWTCAWSQDVRLRVAVEAGQLSVDLREAPVRAVLAAIGRQADLRVRMEAGDARTVTAQFTAMAVEPGLRRVLRAASLSYALAYTPGPGASPALAEVRVFRGALDTAREALPPDAHVRAGAPDGADPVRVALAPQPAVSHPPAPHDAPEALAPHELEPESLELDASEADASASDLTHDWQD
jgi:hypothetical protein